MLNLKQFIQRHLAEIGKVSMEIEAIKIEDDLGEEFFLKPGFSSAEYREFLDSLNGSYADYGGELRVVVWYWDGSWSRIVESGDGEKTLMYCKRPELV